MKPFIPFLVIFAGEAGAQSLLSMVEPERHLTLFPWDSSVLELHKPRHDLPCLVEPEKPELDLNLMFQTGFHVTLPAKALAGAENILTILFRVTAAKHRDRPFYFSWNIRVPSMKQSERGRLKISGAFLVGEGKYHVDWLMRDVTQRLCASFWDFEARVNGKRNPTHLIAQDVVEPVRADPFANEPTIERNRDERLLSVTVILNLTSRLQNPAVFAETDRYRLAAILRMMNRNPRIGHYSIVACSLQTRRVLHRQEAAPQIDMRRLGEAIDPRVLNRVSVDQLAMKNDLADFLSQLIAEEDGKPRTDALILMSNDCPLDFKMPREAIRHLSTPVFYLSLRYSERYAWRSPGDVFARIARELHGVEYAIEAPVDLSDAWSNIVSRITGGEKP